MHEQTREGFPRTPSEEKKDLKWERESYHHLPAFPYQGGVVESIRLLWLIGLARLNWS